MKSERDLISIDDV